MNLAPIINNSLVGLDGEPLAGGFVRTFAANSNTPMLTYKDPFGNVAYDNDIPLNSLGMPADGPVYLQDGPYRFVILDRLGTQIGQPLDYIWGVLGESKGTFVPSLEGLTTPGTQTYAVQLGHYVQRGTTIEYEIFLLLSGAAGAAGSLVIKGLPFKSVNQANRYQGGSVSSFRFNLTSGYTQVGCNAAPNAQYISLSQSAPDGSADTPLTAANLLTNSVVMLSGKYEAVIE